MARGVRVVAGFLAHFPPPFVMDRSFGAKRPRDNDVFGGRFDRLGVDTSKLAPVWARRPGSANFLPRPRGRRWPARHPTRLPRRPGTAARVGPTQAARFSACVLRISMSERSPKKPAEPEPKGGGAKEKSTVMMRELRGAGSFYAQQLTKSSSQTCRLFTSEGLNRANRRLRCLRASACSQMRITCQPLARSRRLTWRSRR